METHVIIGDLQAPYHSRRAVDVACQILETVKATSFTLNGDVVDNRKIAGRYPSDDGARDMLISQLKEELERAGTLVRQITKAANCKTKYWVDGNHEWRIWRAMTVSPQTLQLMGIQSIREALNVVALLGISDLKYRYVGEYPAGFWLRGDASAEQNFWVEHGYIARKKAGYTAHALMDARMSNVICGHVERLACIPKRVVRPGGVNTFFGIEGGNLSGIAEPGEGDKVYTGVPHSIPGFLDHQQGFVILNFDQGVWFPELVRINNGRAFFRGKIYKS